MSKKYSIGDTVKTSDGNKGKVIQTDSARGLVAVKITEPSPGRSEGDEVVYKEKEVK
jgi:hypothetical protein